MIWAARVIDRQFSLSGAAYLSVFQEPSTWVGLTEPKGFLRRLNILVQISIRPILLRDVLESYWLHLSHAKLLRFVVRPAERLDLQLSLPLFGVPNCPGAALITHSRRGDKVVAPNSGPRRSPVLATEFVSVCSETPCEFRAFRMPPRRPLKTHEMFEAFCPTLRTAMLSLNCNTTRRAVDLILAV